MVCCTCNIRAVFASKNKQYIILYKKNLNRVYIHHNSHITPFYVHRIILTQYITIYWFFCYSCAWSFILVINYSATYPLTCLKPVSSEAFVYLVHNFYRKLSMDCTIKTIWLWKQLTTQTKFPFQRFTNRYINKEEEKITKQTKICKPTFKASQSALYLIYFNHAKKK
jgi:hypothetical protein